MSGTIGQAGIGDANSDYNAISFVVRQIMARMGTATVVKVKSVTNSGGVTPVGFVDVIPLVNQVDGQGNATPHITVYHLPYCRLQGGANAVVLDPQIDDIGIVVFASRDISAVKSSKAQANPGSKRRFSMADGIYIGGILNDTPTQYVQFSDSGITINTPHALNLIATGAISIQAGGALTISASNITLDTAGNLTAHGDVKAVTVSLDHHVHSASGGTGVGGPPVP